MALLQKSLLLPSGAFSGSDVRGVRAGAALQGWCGKLRMWGVCSFWGACGGAHSEGHGAAARRRAPRRRLRASPGSSDQHWHWVFWVGRAIVCSVEAN